MIQTVLIKNIKASKYRETKKALQAIKKEWSQYLKVGCLNVYHSRAGVIFPLSLDMISFINAHIFTVRRLHQSVLSSALHSPGSSCLLS